MQKVVIVVANGGVIGEEVEKKLADYEKAQIISATTSIAADSKGCTMCVTTILIEEG